MAQPSNNQNAFWEAMKEKYEKRNETLRRQETCLRKRLEQLKDLMEKQQIDGDCDCVPEKLEKPSLVQCLVEKGKNLILGSCKCVDPKIGQEYLCACGVDADVPLNIDQNLCPISAPQSEVPEIDEGCTCESGGLAQNLSTFSIRTTDMYYMDKLADLVNTEKNMKDKIEDLEKREHSYLNAIKELREAMQKKPKEDPLRSEFNKMAEGLEEENQKLRNELQDMRLELKHCFERVEGPLKRSLEDQKEKCLRLERQLDDLQNKMANKEDNYLKEVNEIKAKLCKACCTMVDLNSVNSKLKEDLISLQNKCTDLEDELLKQQLKEAENILKFKNAISKRLPGADLQNSGDDIQDLGLIAKKLSETLREACPCITDIPSGITETVQNIKQLTEFVVEKGTQQKKKGKLQKCATCSCILDEIEIPQPVETRSVDCGCSNSSLNLKPMMTAESTTCKTSQISCSGSCSLKSMKSNLAVEETVSEACSCCPEQDACSVQTKPPEINSTETVCSCPQVEEKQIGPSEQVLAVRNLGTLSGVSKKKLAVDTTCDVLDVPPKDIHVTTKVAKTGSLEITTEGPPGVIETKVNYLPDGKIEIVTRLVDKDKMGALMDGTLLRIPELPPSPTIECDESRTCGGQCDETNSSHDEPNPDNCECIDEPTDNKEECAPYGQSAVSNFMEIKQTSPFLTTEWKNEDFNDDNNEELLIDIIPKRRNARKNQENVIDADDVVPKALGISLRPSLIDVGKAPADNQNTVQQEQLETIAEGDEDEDLSLDFQPSLGEVARIEEAAKEKDGNDNIKELIISTVQKQKQNENKSKVEPAGEIEGDDMKELFTSAGLKNENEVNVYMEDKVEGEDIKEFLTSTSSELKKHEDKLKDRKEKKSELLPLELKQNEDELKVKNEEIASLIIEEKREVFIDEIEDFKSFGDDVISKVYSKETITVTLDHSTSHLEIELNKSSVHQTNNLQHEEDNSKRHLDLVSPYDHSKNQKNLQLKQTKSMFEKTENHIERLRVCKSATLSFGVKLDIDSLRLWSGTLGDPSVGDFDPKKIEAKMSDALADILCPSLPAETGENVLDTRRRINDQTFQCYMCKCSGKNDSKNSEQGPSQTPDQNLEARIDRLLEINPLQSAHGPNCECVDCLVNAAKKTSAKNEKTGKCECSKTLKHPLGPNIDPEIHGCKCGRKKSKQEHGKDCTCVDCLCNPCNFKKKMGIPCDCKDCDCSECTDFSKGFAPFEFPITPEIYVFNVQVPCDCPGKCECNPCMDESKNGSQPPADNKQGKSAPCKKCQNKLAASQAQRPSILKKTVACGSSPAIKSAEQKCEGPTAISTGETWKHVIASCGPPSEKKEVCECKPCECKPCGYKDKPRKPCDCKPPKKEPKEPPKKGNDVIIEIKDISETTPNIVDKGISERKLNEGSVEVVTGDGEVERHSRGDDVRRFSEKCICVPCLCEFCPDAQARLDKGKVERSIGDAVEDEIETVACDCNTCECETCLGKKDENINLIKKEIKIVLEKLGEEEYTFDKVVSCDCSPCECNECRGKPTSEETPQEQTFEPQPISEDKAQGDQKAPCCACVGEVGFHQTNEECQECLICELGENQKISEIEPEKPKEKIPCDCEKCICEPCPDPQIGDADPTKKELEDVLNKIGCTCDLAEDKLKPLIKQASNFETTISKMKFKLNNLEEKCRDKDQIIKAMTNELGLRSKSGVFANLLNELAHPKDEAVPDFNRTYVCDFLPRPKRSTTKIQYKKSSARFDCPLEPILELDRYLPGEDVQYNLQNLNVSDMEILDIRRITIDSILIKWRKPSNITGIIGYQIFVNEQLKYRVLSPNRTNAVLDSLSLDNSLEIMLFAMTMSGRCEPPALATYKI